MQCNLTTRRALLVVFWGMNSVSYFLQSSGAGQMFGRTWSDALESFGYPLRLWKAGDVYAPLSVSETALALNIGVALICSYTLAAAIGNRVLVQIGDATSKLAFSAREIVSCALLLLGAHVVTPLNHTEYLASSGIAE